MLIVGAGGFVIICLAVTELHVRHEAADQNMPVALR